LSVDEIVKLGESYGLKIEIKGSIAYITSLNNTWHFFIKDVPTGRIELYHKSVGKCKEHYHKQRKFWDLPFMFKSIVSHEEHIWTNKRKKSKMELLYEQIEHDKKKKNKNKLHKTHKCNINNCNNKYKYTS
jgi:hypothetical protein